MYMIEILLYVIVAGQQIGAPATHTSHATYTLEQCVEHLKSEAFATDRAVLVAAALQNYANTHDEEDYAGSSPGITATASCVDDPRV